MKKKNPMIFIILLTSIVILLSGCIEKPKWLSFITSNSNKETFSCEDIVFSTNSGKPFAIVQLNAIPSDFGDFPAIEIENEENTHRAKFPVERQTSGASFIVPAHPDGKAEGGKVTIALMDEKGKKCDPINFTINPLPKKPGAFKEMVELIDRAIKEQQRVLGLDPIKTESNAEPTIFDEPFNIIEDLVSNPDNPNSLERIIDGDAPVTEDLTSNEWELMDGLVEESGVLEEIEQYVERVAEIEPIPQEELEATGAGREETNSCFGSIYQPSASTLSTLMWLQIDNQIGDEVAKETGYLDLSSTLFTVSSILFQKATVGVPNPVAGAAAAMGSAIGAWQTQMEVLSGLLPSNMVTLEFDYQKPEYKEDDPNINGTWGNVMLTTSSNGWDATTYLYDKLISHATGGLTKQYVNTHQTDDFTKATSELLEGMFSKEVTKLIHDPNSKEPGLFNIKPCEFGPTDISDEEYSEGYFTNTEEAPAVVTEHGKFIVRDTGEALLLVRAKREKFALKSIFDTQPVYIDPIKITISPDSFNGDPGDVATFEVTVENAHDPSMEFSIYPERGHKMEVQRNSETSYTVTIVTSSNEDDFPGLLTAVSTSTSGLRGLPNAPPRMASAKLLSGGELTVNPPTACIKPGETEIFTAEVQDLNYKEFTWSASKGSITKDGAFTAPELPAGSKVTITATAVANANVTGTAEVIIGDCVCFGSASFGVGGSMTRMVTEPYIIEPFNTMVRLDGGQLRSVVFNFGDADGGVFGDLVRKGQKGEDVDSSSLDIGSLLGSLIDKAIKGNDGVVLVFENGPKIGQTGRFPALIAGSFGTFGHEFGHDIDASLTMGIMLRPFASMGREKMQPEITVYIESFDEGPEPGTAFIKGHVSGYVHYLHIADEYADEVGTFNMSFNGYYDTKAVFGRACSGAGW